MRSPATEIWPKKEGWTGTTADQLISLAGAYRILAPRLTADERQRWLAAIVRSAGWIERTFPIGNVNYLPTAAVGLVLAAQVVPNPDPAWLRKAAALVDLTLEEVTPDQFVVGEGNGVDLGYNLAQTIGYLALYGKLVGIERHVARAADMLRSHIYFIYPTGAVDNSWGTRSFKWTMESGSKTAPGVHLAAGLLADRDPRFARAATLALSYLRRLARDDDGWIVHGPGAGRHPSVSPPSSYSTFARAQALATSLEFGPAAAASAPLPAETGDWFRFFPSVETGVLRTDRVMATISANPGKPVRKQPWPSLATYRRETFARGGSISALWFEGYGPHGFLQVSSPTKYLRREPMHMPVEGDLLPLTPRIETTGEPYAASVLDDEAKVAMQRGTTGKIEAVAQGVLRTEPGASSGTTFTWRYRFEAAGYSKEAIITGDADVQIVEPFVDLPGNRYDSNGKDTFTITTADGHRFTLHVLSASGGYRLVLGEHRARYWAPFPGVDAYPVVIKPDAAGATATADSRRTFRIEYAVRALP